MIQSLLCVKITCKNFVFSDCCYIYAYSYTVHENNTLRAEFQSHLHSFNVAKVSDTRHWSWLMHSLNIKTKWAECIIFVPNTSLLQLFYELGEMLIAIFRLFKNRYIYWCTYQKSAVHVVGLALCLHGANIKTSQNSAYKNLSFSVSIIVSYFWKAHLMKTSLVIFHVYRRLIIF